MNYRWTIGSDLRTYPCGEVVFSLESGGASTSSRKQGAAKPSTDHAADPVRPTCPTARRDHSPALEPEFLPPPATTSPRSRPPQPLRKYCCRKNRGGTKCPSPLGHGRSWQSKPTDSPRPVLPLTTDDELLMRCKPENLKPCPSAAHRQRQRPSAMSADVHRIGKAALTGRCRSSLPRVSGGGPTTVSGHCTNRRPQPPATPAPPAPSGPPAPPRRPLPTSPPTPSTPGRPTTPAAR